MITRTLGYPVALDTPRPRGLGAGASAGEGGREMRGLGARGRAAQLALLLLCAAAWLFAPSLAQPPLAQPADAAAPSAAGPLSPREAMEVEAERARGQEAAPARAGGGAPPQQTSLLPAAEAARLAEILRDETRRNELLRTLDSLARAAAAASGAEQAPSGQPAQPAPEPPLPLPLAPQSLLAQLLLALTNALGRISEWVVAAARSAYDLPAVIAAAKRLVFDAAVRDRILNILWKAAVVLAAGIAVERLLVALLRPARRRIAAVAADVRPYAHRVALSLGRFVIDLVPVVAFAAVSYAVITAIERWPSQRVLLIVANNAYLAARLARAIGRAAFAPEVPQLRLIPLADETAAYCQVWLQRLTVWTVTGYAFAEAMLIFGLGQAAHDGLVTFVELVLMLFLVLIVLQNRAAVAGLIRAPEEARGPWAVARNRLADIWHALAVAYLVAGWAVSALQISDGYGYLLRFTATTIAVLGCSKLAELAAERLLARVLRVQPDLTGRYPGLEGRVNRYTPVLRTLVHAAIWATAVVVLLELWGLGAFAWFQHGRLGARVLAALASVLFTLVLALLAWESINSAINRHLERLSRDAEAARTARVRTLLPMLRTALRILLIIVVGLIMLNELGVNIAPLLAGAGVIGIAIGFGSQKLVQDLINGVFLLAEDAIAVGDVVHVAGQGGVVEALSIRSIRLRSLDGTVHIVPFSAVTTVSNMTKDFAFAVFDIGVAYGEDTD